MMMEVLTYRRLLTCLIIMTFSLISNGQSYTLDESETTDLKELVKYDETKTSLVPRKFEEKKKEEKKERKELEPLNLGGLGTALKYILYLGIIILVIVILIMLFSNIKIEKKLEEIAPLDLDDIEDIETIDAESGLELALKAENYREAVRMLFIQLLQVLVIEDSMETQKDK